MAPQRAPAPDSRGGRVELFRAQMSRPPSGRVSMARSVRSPSCPAWAWKAGEKRKARGRAVFQERFADVDALARNLWPRPSTALPPYFFTGPRARAR